MSCCGSLFVNLGGGGGGTVNTGVLQIAGGVALDSTLRFVEDQNGTDSVLKLATNKASFDTSNTIFNVDAGFNFGRDGTPVFNFLNYALAAYVEPYFDCLNFRFRCYGSNGVTITDSTTTTPNGALTVKGLGGNIASFRNSANVEVASINSIGSITCPFLGTANNQFGSNYIGLNGLGLTNSSGKLVITDGGFSNYNGLIVGYNTQKGIEVSVSSSNVALGFFGSPAINQPVTGGANATYASVSGSEIKELDTFDGYTVGGVVKALRNLGILA
jgi:hypothetical protein